MKKTIILLVMTIGFRAAFAQKLINAGSHQVDLKVKAGVLKVLNKYMATVNAKDLAGWAATYLPKYIRSIKQDTLQGASLVYSFEMQRRLPSTLYSTTTFLACALFIKMAGKLKLHTIRIMLNWETLK